MALVDNVGATVTIAGRTEGIDPAIKAVRTLTEALQRANEKLIESTRAGNRNSKEQVAAAARYRETAAAATTAANAYIDTSASIKTQIVQNKELIRALAAEKAALQQSGRNHDRLQTGIKGTTHELKKSSKERKEYNRILKQSGSILVGNISEEVKGAQSLRETIRNQRLLNMAMKTNMSGIASASSVNSVLRGIPGQFARALTASERFRLSITALKRDMLSTISVMQRWSKQTQWLGRQMIMGLSLPIAAMANEAIREFGRVSDAQADLQKITYQTGESFEEGAQRIQQEFVPAIREISSAYGQVESITTNVARDWAAMGFATQEQNAQMTELTSQWAMLANIDLSESTEYVRKIYSTFGNNDVEQTIDILNRLGVIEERAAIDTADLAAAMPIAAQSAFEYGMSATDLAGALAGMVEEGVVANEAATALKFSLQRLYNPTDKAREALNTLQVNPAFDDGTLKPAIELFEELRVALQGYSEEYQAQAFGDIFGSRQVNRVLALMNSMGTAGSDFADALEVAGINQEEINDRVREQIRLRQESPEFQLKKLKSEFKMLAADLGRFLMPPLITLFGMLNKLIQKLMELPDGLKAVIAAFTLFLASIGPIVYVTAVLGEAFATVAKGVFHVLPAMNELTPALAKQLTEFGLLNDQIIQQGDVWKTTASKRQIAAAEAKAMEMAAAETAAVHHATVQSVNRVLEQQIALNETLMAQEARKKAQQFVDNAGDVASGQSAAAAREAEGQRAKAAWDDMMRQRQIDADADLETWNRIKKNADESLVAKRAAAKAAQDELHAAKKAAEELLLREERLANIAAVNQLGKWQPRVPALEAEEAFRLGEAGPAANFERVRAKIAREVREDMAKIAAIEQRGAGNWVDTRFGNRGVGAAEVARLETIAQRNGMILKTLEAQNVVQMEATTLANARAAAEARVEAATQRSAAAMGELAAASDAAAMIDTVGPPVAGEPIPRPDAIPPVAGAGAEIVEEVTEEVTEGIAEGVAGTAAKEAAEEGGEILAESSAMGFGGAWRAKAPRLISGTLNKIFHPIQATRAGAAWAMASLAGMREKLAANGGGIQKMLSKLAPASARNAETGLATLPAILGGIAGSLTTILAVIAVIALVAAALWIPFSAIKDNMKSFTTQFQTSLTMLKKAFNGLKQAFIEVVDNIKAGIAEAFGIGGSKEDINRQLAEKFGEYADAILGFLTTVVNAISWALEKLGPFFQWIGHVMGSMMQFMTELFQGHWMNALGSIPRLLYALVGEPVVGLMDMIVDAVLQALRGIVTLIADFGSMIGGSLSWVPGVESLTGDIENSLRGFADWFDEKADDLNMRNYLNNRIFNSDTKNTADSGGEDLGKDVGEGFSRGLEENGPGGSGSGGSENEWLSGWLSAIKSQLEKQIDELKKAALDALDKKYEANLKVYDDRIQAIEDVEEAEEKALARKEYLSRRRELIANRELQRENYRRDRALAIYEGRIDDARTMDREEQKNRKDHSKELADLDEGRRRELLKQERDHQKELLNIQKEALDERQKTMRDAFEKQLDLITEYAPKTIGEYQNMLNGMTGLLAEYGINTWPGLMFTGMGLFQDVIRRANRSVVEDAAWSGKNAATSWLAAFISGDAQAALSAGDTAPSSGSYLQSGGPGGGGGGFRTIADIDPTGSRYVRHQGGYLGAGPAQDIPITAQTGEYVIQRSAVQKYGTPFLSSLNHGVYHTGGMIGVPSPNAVGVPNKLYDVMQPAMKGFVGSGSDNWMKDSGFGVAVGTPINGVDPATIYEAFLAGGTVGGQQMADFMAQFLIGEGVPIQQFANWINQTFPGLHAATGIGTHSYYVRGTDRVSLHTLQRAVDVSGPVPLMDHFFNFMLNAGRTGTIPIQELIYQHMKWSPSRGNSLGFYSLKDHFNHVHVGLVEGFAQMMMQQFGRGANYPGSLRTWMAEAVRITGVPMTWLEPLMARAMQESSGDPNAINLWDSNAAKGQPSKGLMQTIDSTFNAYKLPGMDNIWNPVHNAVAAIRYIIARYGSVFNLPKGGYHAGGLISPAAQMMMGGKVPYDNFPALLHKGEIVVPEKHTGMLRGEGGGDTHVHIHADTFLGDFEWFRDKMEEYDIKISPKKARARGQVNRRIGVR